MSKRVHRYRNPNLPQEAFNNPIAAVSSTAAAAAPQATASARKINWRDEYSEVLGDLRKTAIIAVAMVAVMAVLSFIVR